MAPKIILPLKEQILQAMKVADNSIEASEYLVQSFKNLLTRAKMTDKASDMLARVERYGELVKMKLSKNRDPWLGEGIEDSEFKNLQENLAQSAAEVLLEQGVSEGIDLDLILNDRAELARMYSKSQEFLEPEQMSEYDRLFNAWLAEHDIVTEAGVLYEADANGKILLNKHNEKVRVDSGLFESLLQDPVKGYDNYIQDKGLPSLNIRQHTPPRQTTQAATTAPQQTAEPEITPKNQSTTPEDATPSAGSGVSAGGR